MKRIIFQEPFIFATGLAALAHSTWALGTLFAGPEPTQFTEAWFAWLIPALLIAFSLDVGQISTSAKIRNGERTRGRYLTFATFAVATYYLQWLYISHHMPELTLAAGVGTWSVTFSSFLRDLAQWIIPALLPLSTVLYTFSDSKTIEPQHSEPIRQSAPELPKIDNVSKSLVVQSKDVVCPDCGWSRSYPNVEVAKRALSIHLGTCSGIRIEIPDKVDVE